MNSSETKTHVCFKQKSKLHRRQSLGDGGGEEGIDETPVKENLGDKILTYTHAHTFRAKIFRLAHHTIYLAKR